MAEEKKFASANEKEPQQTEMSGQRHLLKELEVLVLNHVVEDDRHPFPEKKKEQYFAAFADEPFVFDGEVRSLLVTNAYVKRDLAGSLNAYLFSQASEEVITEHADFGEYPTPIGTLYLELRDGLPCVKVAKWKSRGEWSNENYKMRHNS